MVSAVVNAVANKSNKPKDDKEKVIEDILDQKKWINEIELKELVMSTKIEKKAKDYLIHEFQEAGYKFTESNQKGFDLWLKKGIKKRLR